MNKVFILLPFSLLVHCIPNPCYNGGTCIATATDYICECPDAYIGSHCETIGRPQQVMSSCTCALFTPTESLTHGLL